MVHMASASCSGPSLFTVVSALNFSLIVSLCTRVGRHNGSFVFPVAQTKSPSRALLFGQRSAFSSERGSASYTCTLKVIWIGDFR